MIEPKMILSNSNHKIAGAIKFKHRRESFVFLAFAVAMLSGTFLVACEKINNPRLDDAPTYRGQFGDFKIHASSSILSPYFPTQFFVSSRSWKPVDNWKKIDRNSLAPIDPKTKEIEELESISLFVKYPSMTGATSDNYLERRQALSGLDENPWLHICFTNKNRASLERHWTREKAPAYSAAYSMRMFLDIVFLNNRANKKTSSSRPKFNEALGLSLIEPESSDIPISRWDSVAYWAGDAESPTTAIACADGPSPQKQSSRRLYVCKHLFYLSAEQSEVEISYSRSLLPQWKEIEIAAKSLFTKLSKSK